MGHFDGYRCTVVGPCPPHPLPLCLALVSSTVTVTPVLTRPIHLIRRTGGHTGKIAYRPQHYRDVTAQTAEPVGSHCQNMTIDPSINDDIRIPRLEQDIPSDSNIWPGSVTRPLA